MTANDTHAESDPRPRKQRSDGERSRNAILREAAQLATVEGLGGLSIGRLAEAVGMSKSGLFAHFGSKEELQLATIETARVLFNEQVFEPGSDAPSGIERLRHLAENFLHHVESSVYPGGCFFAAVAAEMDTSLGEVRTRAVEVVEEVLHRLETAAHDAQVEGAIDASVDTKQLAFELDAFMFLANAQFVLTQSSAPVDRARNAIASRLAAAAPADVG